MRKLVAVPILLALVTPRPAGAVNRIVAAAASEKPVAAGTEAVLFIRRTAVQIGDGCPGDGLTPDAAPAETPDAAPASPDAAPASPDAALPGCETIPGDAVTMVVQPQFAIGAAGARFAILLVTPSDPIVEVEAHDLFATLEDVTAPDVDIIEQRVQDPALGKQCGSTSTCGNWDYDQPPSWDPPPLDGMDTPAIETVGPYEIARSRPADPGALTGWLDSLDYTYSPDDVDAVAPYLALGYTVIAVRVIALAQLDGGLEPLALTWAGTEMRVPLGLARSTAPAWRELAVFVAAEGRFDVPDARVDFAQYTSWGPMRFLTRNDLTVDLRRTAAEDPVLTRVAGDPTYWATETVTQTVRVPVDDCGDDFDFGCCRVGRRGAGPVSSALVAGALVLAVRRRRRR